MNIAFDMSFAKGVSLTRGIGRYSKHLIESLSQISEAHSFFYFYPDFSSDALPLKNQIQRFIQQNQIDLFHILSPFESFNQLPSHQEMMNREYYGNTKVAVTLYDIIPLIFEKEYLQHPDVKAQYMRILYFIRSCDVIFAISEATKQDAIRTAGIPAEKVHVIMAGIDERFKPSNSAQVQETLRQYRIQKPYVMCTGGMDFRKNTDRLLEGFALANKKLQSSYQLVLCCNITDADRQRLTALSYQLGIGSDLILTGFVPDEDLLALYQGASLFVFPSLYEGFGFPVVEAMACGVPVVTSNNSSLGEIAADCAKLVNPYHSPEIAKGISKVLLNPKLGNKLRELGSQRAAAFQWSFVAEKALSGYQTVYRKKIAVFSPLPPVKSGISDYQVRILPALSERYDCEFFVDDGYLPEIDRTIPGIQVYRHFQFPSRAQSYDAIIYQVGNSGYHLYMIPYIHKYPGIVVLHDLNLHGMTISWTLALNDKDTYYQVIKANFGSNAREIVNRVLDGTIQRAHEHITINKYYLSSAKAVLVHNRYGQGQLSDLPSVALAKLPISIPESADAPPIDKSHFKFASFGYLPPHKHIDAVIRALGQMVAQGITDAHYYIVGQVDTEYKAELERIIRELNIEPYVHFTGRLDRDQYEHYLWQADVAVNLRYPTYGESSASLLDTLAHGVPTIVSDIGSFREFPEQVVLKVPANPRDGIALLEAMLDLYHDKAKLEKMSEEAVNYIRDHHSIEAYVGELAKLIDSTKFNKAGAGLSTILWENNDRFYQEGETPPVPLEAPKPIIDTPELPSPHEINHAAEAEAAAQANFAPSVLDLQPAKLRTRRSRTRGATYAAFQLNELNPGAVQRAILQIPVARKKGRMQINRIRRRWGRAGRPLSYRRPIFSRKVRGPLLLEYDCTALIHYWLHHPERNHGLRLSGVTRPTLKVYLS